MSLPGLQLSEPKQNVATSITTVYEIKEGTEWRFEVAFGSEIKVKVRRPLLF